MEKITRRAWLAGTAAVAFAPPVKADASSTALVVPFPPGGSTDALARMMQPGLQAALGHTVVVENKSGAAGSIGAAYVARSTPDGSAFLVTFDSHAVIPAILEKPLLNVETDLVPVTLVGTAPYVIAVNADRPYRTFADVVKACKQNPGSVKYASVGIGTLGHLAMTVLGKLSGVEITHVPYRGGGPAMNDVLGGHVDLIAGSAALITPHLAGNRIRPLMQLGPTRLKALPDTPTAIESGYKDFTTVAWWGVFATKGTSGDLIAKTDAAIRKTLSEPATATKLRDSQQMTLVLEGPKDFAPFFEHQVKYWGGVVRDNHIKPTGG